VTHKRPSGLALGALLLLLLGCGHTHHTGKHVRWDVKTLQDFDTAWLTEGGLYPAEKSTIAEMNELIAPDGLHKNSPREAKEEILVVVGGYIDKPVKPEGDGDMHILLKDDNRGASITAEVPNPDAPDVRDSRFAAYFRAVRRWIVDSLQPPPSPNNPYHVVITGVRFFDDAHAKTEVHPVLGIRMAKRQ
jgi:hypothetical protein